MISIKIIPIKRIFYQNYVKFTNINKDYSKIMKIRIKNQHLII